MLTLALTQGGSQNNNGLILEKHSASFHAEAHVSPATVQNRPPRVSRRNPPPTGSRLNTPPLTTTTRGILGETLAEERRQMTETPF